ncbi:MAG: hypothetical protein ACYTDY_12305 [Planctomycetota bacterium]|jgi:hypothetical protein
MRKVGALVLGLIVVGLAGTAGFAALDDTTEFKGEAMIISKLKVDGIKGSHKAKWESVGDAIVSVGNMVTTTHSLAGTFSQTLGAPATKTALVLLGGDELFFPSDPSKDKDTKRKLNAEKPDWMKVFTDSGPMLPSLENMVNQVHTTVTDTLEMPGKSKPPLAVGGPIGIDELKSKGIIKSDKAGTKFKLKLSVKYTGKVLDGKNKDKKVKGKIKIKIKKGSKVVPAN